MLPPSDTKVRDRQSELRHQLLDLGNRLIATSRLCGMDIDLNPNQIGAQLFATCE
jgi:hypothetical protein